MGVFDWFFRVLNRLGLWKKTANILFLGIQNAGKTTLLHLLKTGAIKKFDPTDTVASEHFSLGSINFRVHDIGGQTQLRELWEEYYPSSDAIVFIVDAADSRLLEAAVSELQKLLTNPELAGKPVLVFGNKVDRMDVALNHDQLLDALNIRYQLNDNPENGRPLQLFMTSFINKQGYGDGFRWLSEHLE
eukprot:TRINITY_DN87_c0_g1_i1.p1 TRINITY_DN87_c0_g1~~TRINITY_DN87_c0_g1_i1.p1  ORF type:complete len:189 (-),score=61.99 TRINITY_DN87_c0_g1_i1:34-600(-)